MRLQGHVILGLVTLALHICLNKPLNTKQKYLSISLKNYIEIKAFLNW